MICWRQVDDRKFDNDLVVGTNENQTQRAGKYHMPPDLLKGFSISDEGDEGRVTLGSVTF